MKAKAQLIILTTVGIAALATAMLGYTGIWSKLTTDPYYDVKQEAYSAIERAQLWYMRPLSSGGGGKSFMDLDFKVLGYDVGADSNFWQGRYGALRLQKHRVFNFDMTIKANDGTVFSSHDLAYDTRPVFSLE